MAGKKPDFDVTVAVQYGPKTNQQTKWHNVGAGWKSENGFISFNLVTNPGVHFVICPRKEKENGRDVG